MLKMSDTSIRGVLPFFANAGLQVAFLVPTPTGYQKSIMDATLPLREQTSNECAGNHSGVLIFDEPAQHSIGAHDTKAFFDSILKLSDRCQVIIGITINNADIRKVISEIEDDKCNLINIGEKAFV